ncbi:PqiB family protein [Pseudomonas sp. M30-35]|uniref:PqiB family protein n=1 Tax=Pseudomonas sp. M30-35 TaxID=1981174 RepID=UPI000B3C9146|nr:MlaD family protein [Pseudomonas sp. M30-35]ARU87445.1 mammalian cell entry protein [Pseudomonas sp. M30-35]
MNDLPLAKKRPASNWSAIWVLPIIALLIGGWLAWKAYDQAGIMIEVRFPSGGGIEAGKTEVIYKGIAVGKVKTVSLDTEGKADDVVATIEMSKEAEGHLLAETRFWLVKPSVSLAGVTGLETLVSGNYIAVSPGKGEPTLKFKALDEPPPLSSDTPGLHLTLKADRLGSIDKDSPIFYRQLKVGRVKDYVLDDDQQTIRINIFIQPEYANLVRKHTRFWNASGITIDAGLSGFKLRTESLASIVAGGIAFGTAEDRKDSPPTDPSLPFRLYDSFDAAQAGIKVVVKLPDFDGLEEKRTPVMYKGIQVGTLKKLKVNDNLQGAIAELALDPLTERYLVDGTEFWVVKPSISLAGITGIEALVKGNYIAVRPGKKGGSPTREFEALSKAPPLDLGAPGLHMVLRSKNLGSIEIGSPILYHQLKVGSVQSYQLARNNKEVLLGVHILPEYTHLVNRTSYFWNASGVTLKGGLSGIEVKSESLQTLIAGGIAFETADLNGARSSKRIQMFSLYKDREDALKAGTTITIRVDRADGLKPGAAIRYKGMDVGTIESLELTKDLQAVQLNARITQGDARIARAGSKFWVVKPELGLTQVGNLDTLVRGQYVEVLPGNTQETKRTQFIALSEPPNLAESEAGLRLVLSASRRGSLKTGVPVTYREVVVGKVVSYELGATADRVLIHILIEPRYKALVHTGSRFWNTSGIGVDAGLFKGVKLRTESLETILAGGVSFATPDNADMGNQAINGQTFALFDEPKTDWLHWAPKIPLPKQ